MGHSPHPLSTREASFSVRKDCRAACVSVGLSLIAALLAGCGMGSPAASVAVPEVAHLTIKGSVHGGQQPVSSAVIQLYAVGTTGDGSAAQPLLTQTVLTNATGGFTITGIYTCPSASTPVYLTGVGGNPGLGGSVNNTAIAMMASLGACGGLSNSTFISMNEVTTVGSLAALFPFGNGYASIGSQASDAALLSMSVANVNMYTNTGSGVAPGSTLPGGYYASTLEIYSLSNSIAACINSVGGVANDGSACGNLFALATPAGGPAPTDTVGAVLNILKNPSQNVAGIFNLAGPAAPFQPTANSAPAKWVLPITATSNPTISVAVNGAASANVGTPVQYSASVSGITNQGVTWQVNGVTGGNATYGTISPTGLYTPPASVPAANSLAIGASSRASTTAAATQAVTLLNPVPVVTTAAGTANGYGQSFLVDIKGTGFVNGATLLVNGSPVATTAVTLSDLQTTVTNTSGTSMQVSVVVANPTPGATQSTSSSVTLTLPGASATAAARFLDQTSFGPTAATIDHVQQIGLLASLTEQFGQPTTLFTVPTVPTTQCSSTWRCTQSDWLKIATTANDQLRQRVSMLLTEIWVAPNQSDGAMPFYLNTAANDAFTNYRTIMTDLSLAPTMGAYLNMANSALAPTGQIPNENFGREVMQLFTMGLDTLNADGTPQRDMSGNPVTPYTETQVAAFAKAFTGWTYANADGTTPTAFNYTANWNHAMVAVEAKHDKTAKILLSGTTLPANQTTAQDLKGALDNIFAQSNVGPFICRQLIQHLVAGDPSPAYVQRVSSVFANNGSGVRGDMQAVLTAIFLDTEARAGDTQTGDQADASPAVQGGHLREPLLWVANVMRGLNSTQITVSEPYPFINLTANGLNNLNEQPLNQASVFNYFSPLYTLPLTTVNAPEFALENTGTVIPRLTLADQLIHSNSGYGVKVDLSATGVFGSKASTPATLVDYLASIFMHGQMPTNMRNAIIAEVTSVPSSAVTTRTAIAAYLVLTASQYKILH